MSSLLVSEDGSGSLRFRGDVPSVEEDLERAGGRFDRRPPEVQIADGDRVLFGHGGDGVLLDGGLGNEDDGSDRGNDRPGDDRSEHDGDGLHEDLSVGERNLDGSERRICKSVV